MRLKAASVRPILCVDEALMSCEDFTGDKPAEIALRESEANFRVLAEHSIAGIFIVQGERFVYINPVFTEATGYTLKDLSSMSFWDIISPGMREVVKVKARARQQTGSTAPAKYELKVVTKSGQEKFANVEVTLIEFKEKPAILGSVTDLTERKRMEDALRTSEEKYRAIFENAMEGIFQTTPDGRFLSANPAIARIHGYDTPEELIRNVDDLAKVYVDPDCRARFMTLLDAESEVKNFKCEVYRKDGRKRWISLTARAVRDPEGAILYHEGTVEDVTERMRTEEALKEREEELERKSVNLEEANAALKVLLKLREDDKKAVESSVLANIEELVFPYLERLKGMCLTDNQATFLGIIEQNLNHVISPFLQKMSSGYSHFTPTEIQIANLIKNGKTSKEIASCLNIGTATVNSHRNDIRSKLGLNNQKVNLRSYLLSFK